MKRSIIIIVFCAFCRLSSHAQDRERYSALNIGAGIGYYYGNYGAPSLNLNYEFDVFRNFTLAPYIAFSSYRESRYWGNDIYPGRYYRYTERIIPVGLKASYYFDELFEAGENWDFYLGASVGYAFRTSTWENGYYGERTVTASPLLGNLHIGTEYKFNTSFGIFLDVSTGISTLGLGIHF